MVSNDSDLCEALNLVKQHHPQKWLALLPRALLTKNIEATIATC